MAITFTSIKPYITPDVMPCPDIIIERELIAVIRDFCQQTGIVVKDFNADVSALTPDSNYQDSIDIILSTYYTEYDPIMMIRLNIDGIEYTPEQREFLNTLTYFDTIKKDGVKYFKFTTATNLRLYDMDGNEKDVYISLTLKPSSSIVQIDDFLWNDWGQYIKEGVIAKILLMPGKAWTDTKSAAVYQTNYKRGISKARIYAIKYLATKAQEVNPVPFGKVVME